MSTWKQLSFINMPRKSDGHGIRNPVRWKVITKHYAKFSRAISLDDPAASILGISKKKNTKSVTFQEFSTLPPTLCICS